MKSMVMKKDGDYTLVARVNEDGTIHEYVVAWCYDECDDTWAQGHYFSDIVDAVCYMDKGLKQKLRLVDLVRTLTDPDVDEFTKEEEFENFCTDYPYFCSERLEVLFK